jgi:hypothetical protein
VQPRDRVGGLPLGLNTPRLGEVSLRASRLDGPEPAATSVDYAKIKAGIRELSKDFDRSAAKHLLREVMRDADLGYASDPKGNRGNCIRELVGLLEAHRPFADPGNHLDLLCKSWRLDYTNLPAKFGWLFKQSRDIDLDIPSFFVLPQIPVRQERVDQVILPDGTLTIASKLSSHSSIEAQLAVRGSFRESPKQSDRLLVTFSQVAISFSGSDEDEHAWRRTLGIEDSSTTRCVNLRKSLSQWSDVTYLDDDLRVARAPWDSLYVMTAADDCFGDFVKTSEHADAERMGETLQAMWRRLSGTKEP